MAQRAFIGTSTVTLSTEDAAGNLVAASSVSVSGSAHDGASVTLGSVTLNSPTGVHSASMTVSVPTLVTLVWTADGVQYTDTIDVMSRPYATVYEVRNSDSSLASTAAATIAAGIELAEFECQTLTGRSHVRRYDVATLTAHDECVMFPFPDIARIGRVYTGESLSSMVLLTDTSGVQTVPGSTGVVIPGLADGSIVTIGVEHGLVEPSPRVRWAVMVRARQLAQYSGTSLPLYSERVTIGEFGASTRMLPKFGSTNQWEIAGRSTGVAEVDAIYAAARFGGMGIG